VPTPPAEDLYGVFNGDLDVVDEVQPVGGVVPVSSLAAF
jgi:hypothetical protein